MSVAYHFLNHVPPISRRFDAIALLTSSVFCFVALAMSCSLVSTIASCCLAVVVVWKSHIHPLLHRRLVGLVFLHSFYEQRKCVRFYALVVSLISLSFAYLIFSSVGLLIILSGRFRQKNYLEDLL